MEYNNDLVRAILEYVAKHGKGRPLYHPEFDNYGYDEVELHVKACIVAKLIDGSKSGHARSLTLMGQTELNNLRALKEQQPA